MKIAPKILVIIPTYQPQKKLLNDVLENIAYQKYRNHFALILVNNSNQEYYDYVVSTTEKVLTDTGKNYGFHIKDLGSIPQVGNYKASPGAIAFNAGLDHAIKNNYDYALLVAGDVALPDITIRELLKPFRKFKDCGLSCLTCYIRYSGDGGMQAIMNKISDVDPRLDTEIDQKIPMIKPLDPPIDAKRYYREKYLKALAGDGAMMIPRKVFSKIKMRDSYKDGKYGADIAYCLDMNEQLGLFTYIVTDVYTPHLNIESNGKIVYY